MEETILRMNFNKDRYLHWKIENGFQILNEMNSPGLDSWSYTKNINDNTDSVFDKGIFNWTNNFKCKFCPYIASSESQKKCVMNMKRHINIMHDEIINYKCDSCSYWARDKYRLKNHVSAVHLRIKNSICDFCSFSAFSRFEIDKHVMATHDIVKHLKCEFCTYSSCHIGTLKKHAARRHKENMHKNATTYVCEQCHFPAFSAYTLKKHTERVHHAKCGNRKPPRRKFLCDQCIYSSEHKSRLKSHIERVHQEVHFSNSQQLKIETIDQLI